MMEQIQQTYSDQRDPNAFVMTIRGLERPEQIRARDLCAAKIERFYPSYAQLNILRAGTDTDKAKMGAFIDACRNWSNGANPDPAFLENIQP